MTAVRRVVGEAGDALGAGVSRLRLRLSLRLTIVGAMAAAVVASLGAGGGVIWIVPTLFVVGAIVAAVRPDTHVAFGLLVAFGWFWLAHVDRATSPWTLLAAAGVLVFHVAVAAAALGPDELELPATLLREWARRAAPVFAGTVVLWLLTVGLRHLDAGANMLLTALALGVLAVAGWLALARSRPSSPP